MSADDPESTEEFDGEAGQSDMVHERRAESPAIRWVLLDGNRRTLTALISGAVFLVCAAVGFAGFIPVFRAGTATTLVGAIVGGTLPFITIVLAINQLVLSQELGWPGDLSERFEGMTDFRREVEALTDTEVSPAAPADFLKLVVDSVVEQTETLRLSTDRTADPDCAAVVGEFADAVVSEGELVSDSLEDADFGTFDALTAVLGHFDGRHLYAVRRIRSQYGADLSEEGRETLDLLVELLGALAVARQTFKTLYVQHQLAHLSSLLLVVGFPTLLGGGLFMMAYPTLTPVLGRPSLLLVVSAVVTLVFLPFVVLMAHTFRIAAIAARTADFGPFVPRVGFDGESSTADRPSE